MQIRTRLEGMDSPGAKRGLGRHVARMNIKDSGKDYVGVRSLPLKGDHARGRAGFHRVEAGSHPQCS
jgi:hypothetical protein